LPPSLISAFATDIRSKAKFLTKTVAIVKKGDVRAEIALPRWWF